MRAKLPKGSIESLQYPFAIPANLISPFNFRRPHKKLLPFQIKAVKSSSSKMNFHLNELKDLRKIFTFSSSFPSRAIALSMEIKAKTLIIVQNQHFYSISRPGKITIASLLWPAKKVEFFPSLCKRKKRKRMRVKFMVILMLSKHSPIRPRIVSSSWRHIFHRQYPYPCM